MSSTLSLRSSLLLSNSSEKGQHIPLLGFGVYKNYDAKSSCLEAFNAGYRHVDSAQCYRNEAAVGEAVKAEVLKQNGLERADFFITTKCVSRNHVKILKDGTRTTYTGVDDSLKAFAFGDKSSAKSRDGQTAYTPTSPEDYIDLFLIHDPISGRDRRLATYEALQDARKQGKIRSVGVSNYGVPHLLEIEDKGLEKPSVNQIELHPFCQQKEIVAYCEKNGIVIQAYCPLMQGKPELMGHPVIQAIAQKYTRDTAQILLRWSLQKGYIPLPKSATPSRIHSNKQLYDFELNADDMARLNGLDRPGREGCVSWNVVNAA